MPYDVFISYSHSADALLAERLQQGLQRFAKPWHRRAALSVFRDKSALSANPGLWTSITQAMDESRYFVLLASPHAASSEWVQREVGAWCAAHPPETLFIALTDGEIVWDDRTNDFDLTRTTALSVTLAGYFREEPLWVDLRLARGEPEIDLRHARFRDAVAELAAPIHGVAKDDLESEDILLHRRALRLARGGTSVLALLLVVAIVAAVVAVRERNHARDAARRSQSITMAAESTALLSTNGSLSVLLSIEARRRAGTQQAIDALATAASEPIASLWQAQSSGFIWRVAFSPDGSALAAGGDNGMVELKNLEDGRTSRKKLGNFVNTLAFSPDGKQLAVNTDNGNVLLDLETKHAAPLDAHASIPGAVAFSPDGSILASEGNETGDDTIALYDLRTHRTATLHDGAPTNGVVAFSPDGKTLASGAVGGRVVLHSLATGRTRRLAISNSVWSLAFSPDGRTLAVGGSVGQLVLIDLASEQQTIILEESTITGVAFSPDGTLVASANTGGQATLYNTQTHKSEILNDGSEVETIAFSPDGSTVATGDAVGRVLAYDVRGGLARTFSVASRVEVLAFSPDGRTLAVGDDGHEVAVYDRVSGRTVRLPAEAIVSGVAYSPDGKSIAVADVLGAVTIDDPISRRSITIQRSQPANENFPGVMYSPDGTTLAFDDGPQLVLEDLRRHKTIRRTLRRGPGTGSAYFSVQPIFSPDGNLVALGDNLGNVYVYDRAGGHTTRLALGDGKQINTLAFSPDGKTLAAGGDAEHIVFYNLQNRRTRVLNEGSGIYSVAFGPDGQTLAFGGGSRRVTVLDLATSRSTTFNEGSEVYWVAFSRDGKTLAAGDASGRVVLRSATLWTSSFDQLKARLCHELGNLNLTQSEWTTYVPDRPYRPTCQ